MIVTTDCRKTASHIKSFNENLALNERKTPRNISEKGFYFFNFYFQILFLVRPILWFS